MENDKLKQYYIFIMYLLYSNQFRTDMTFSFNFCKGLSLSSKCLWWRQTEREGQGRKCRANNDIKRFRL